MQGAVLNDRRSPTFGREGTGDSFAGRSSGNLKASQTVATPHEWLRRIARAVVGLTRKETDARRDVAYGAHSLGKGWVKRTHFPNGGRIACQEGRVWITADGDGEDIVLSGGGCRWFRPGAWVVIEAMAKSEIIVEC